MDFELTRTDVLKVDGAYGESAFNKSIIAGVVGLLAIIVMMILIYKIPGVISSITLVFYTAMIIVVFNLIGGEYGPDTIAAIVIGLGMAVDACIILFERLQDELYKGRSVKAAYEESTKKYKSFFEDYSNVFVYQLVEKGGDDLTVLKFTQDEVNNLLEEVYNGTK